MELVGENIDSVWEEFSAPLEDTFFVFETPIDQQGTRLNYIESQIWGRFNVIQTDEQHGLNLTTL